MESKALEVVAQMPTDVFQPVMSIDAAVERRDAIVAFVKRIMVEDQDFGVIPGTKSKPVLLKPGAEKLSSFFGLEPESTQMAETMDLLGVEHNGEPFYYIRYKVRLIRQGVVMGVGEGSCNSWESKYRYRDASRKCPVCNAEAIIKGKEEYGGGWLCFGKKGGCGAKFGDNDKSITEQKIGRTLNPDVADLINTIQKMAHKRALVAATLLATSASEFFTQDLEDNPPEPDPVKKSAAERKQTETRSLAGQPKQSPRGDGATGSAPTQPASAAQSPEESGSPTSAQAAREIPVPLKVIFDKLHEPGRTIEAFKLLQNRMLELSPAGGAAEYKRIQKAHGITLSSTIQEYKKCLLDMWDVCEEWSKQDKGHGFGSTE